MSERDSSSRSYCIKRGYNPNFRPQYYEDNPPAGLVFQPDVYRLALFLAQRSGAKMVIDVGSGNGEKLKPFAECGMQVIAFDVGSNIDKIKASVPGARVIVADLEKGLPGIRDDALRQAVVICSDVIEHLVEPHALLKSLARIGDRAKYLCVSTPDRERARGAGDAGPPLNPAHVREWSLDEFHALALAYGLNPEFLGRTVNTNRHLQKNNIFLLDGAETRANAGKPVRVLAIVNVYNEIDILPEVIAHLLREGMDVQIFDNWSTDGSWECAQAAAGTDARVRAERFPESPRDFYEWSEQLRNVEQFAQACDYDWILHYDADELRESPWRRVTMQNAIGIVDALGYNAIDFTVLDYRFLPEQSVRSDYRAGLTFFEFGRRAGHQKQIKGWKRLAGIKVDLHGSGGHDAQFPGRRIYPLKFLNRHYSLRNPEQAASKVFQHRKPRFAKERKALGWHVQYDRFAGPGDIAWKAHELIACSDESFRSDFLVERLSGIGLFD